MKKPSAGPLPLLAYVSKFKSQRKAADKLGICAQYLSDMLNGRRPVSDKIAAKIGLKKVTIYEEIAK